MLPSVEDLCRDLPIREYPAGTILLTEGQNSGRLFVLVDGDVEVLKGEYQINIVSDAGAVFGEMSVLLGIPHMATVRTMTPCRLHVAEDANAFLQSHRDIAYHLAKLLAKRLVGVTAYLVDLKHQFKDHGNHLSMVDEVLEALVHQQADHFTPGSDRDPGY